MPHEALGSRLLRLPGVAGCTEGSDAVRVVATPGTDVRLLRARAQAVCADAGDRRPLAVVATATPAPAPAWVVQPQPAFLTRIGGSKAVAIGSALALSLIVLLPGRDGRTDAPSLAFAPAPTAVTAATPAPSAAEVAPALGQALSLGGGPLGRAPGGMDGSGLEVASTPPVIAGLASAFSAVPTGNRLSPTPAPPAASPVPAAAVSLPAAGDGSAAAEPAPAAPAAPATPEVASPAPAPAPVTTVSTSAPGSDRTVVKGKASATAATSKAKAKAAAEAASTATIVASEPVEATARVATADTAAAPGNGRRLGQLEDPGAKGRGNASPGT